MKSTILLFVFVLLRASLCTDYYWRDFDTGEVPDDAVEAGRYRGGSFGAYAIYVGQGHVFDEGVFPGDLQNTSHGGSTAIHVISRGSSVVIGKFNKILCSGHKENFRWIPVTSYTLHAQTINKTVVIGGHENNQLLFIGRIVPAPGGWGTIGKVVNFQTPGSARLFYQFGGELSSDSFDILAYV